MVSLLVDWRKTGTATLPFKRVMKSPAHLEVGPTGEAGLSPTAKASAWPRHLELPDAHPQLRRLGSCKGYARRPPIRVRVHHA